MADEQIVDSEVYDAGEHRLHYQHAALAYDFAQRADNFAEMARHDTEQRLNERAQWHATMALYEASAPKSCDDAQTRRAASFSDDERSVIAQALEPFSCLLGAPEDFTRAAKVLLAEFRPIDS